MGISRIFGGGVHPIEAGKGKDSTKSNGIIDLTPPAKVTIPMSMHAGAPATVCVQVGQEVKLGQVIGEAKGAISAPVHASVSGKVVAVGKCMLPSGREADAVTIENDFKDEWDPSVEASALTGNVSAEQIIEAARSKGIVGMGGAGFPTAVKLDTSKLDPKPDVLVVNGSECEPYLTSDHRIMVECADRVAEGIVLALKATGCQKAFVGIEDNKPDAVEAMKKAAQGRFEVVALPARYPQGFEKMLIYSLTGRKVPNGALPSAAGCVVLNVGTCEALCRAVREGRPLIDRVVTVAGHVNKPGNFRIRIGATALDLEDAAEGFGEGVTKIIVGGGMMGNAIPSINLPVTKNFGGLVTLAEEGHVPEESACIRCGRCVRACPMKLMPTRIDAYARHRDWAGAVAAGAKNCMECGCCTYVCPAKRQLTQSIRMAKALARIKKL